VFGVIGSHGQVVLQHVRLFYLFGKIFIRSFFVLFLGGLGIRRRVNPNKTFINYPVFLFSR